MKKEHFIEKARAIHGDKFDYSLLPDEFPSKSKVPVICATHGTFQITSDNHIHNKRGCPSCGAIGRSVNNRHNLSSVIKQISDKHQNLRIDYSEYVDKASPLKVACSCGNFFMSAAKDLLKTKYGCPVCSLIGRGLTRRKSLDTFLQKANKAHNGRYDYSKVELNTFQEKVEIACDRHGSFWQEPFVHVKGHGCPECAAELRGNLRRKELENMPAWMFSDPNVIPVLDTYRNLKTPMKFLCKFHGEVYRNPVTNLKGSSSCPKCSIEKLANERKSSNDEFLAKAKGLFPNYDYSQVLYDGMTNYITLTCDKGHTFKQRAGNLLSGYGCPSCARSGFSYDKVGYLYILKIDNIYGKIGISNKYLKRVSQIINKSKVDVELIKVYTFEQGVIAKDIETFLLASEDLKFSVVSKADMPDGYTETFYLKDLELILSKITKYIESV